MLLAMISRKIFGDKSISKYECQPIVRTPGISVGDDGAACKPAYMKLKK